MKKIRKINVPPKSQSFSRSKVWYAYWSYSWSWSGYWSGYCFRSQCWSMNWTNR